MRNRSKSFVFFVMTGIMVGLTVRPMLNVSADTRTYCGTRSNCKLSLDESNHFCVKWNCNMSQVPATGTCSPYIPPTTGCERKPSTSNCTWSKRLSCPSSGNATESYSCTNAMGVPTLTTHEIEPPTCCLMCDPCEIPLQQSNPRCEDSHYVVVVENSVERCCPASPILIDVKGNGFDLTDAANGVKFDINGDGIREKLSWTSAGSDDAWLALDRDGNGTIDRGSELFGNYTLLGTGLATNGFDALAEFDSIEKGGNNNGMIDRLDAIYFSLRLWQDTNHNARSEPQELKSLPQVGIEMFDLAYRFSEKTDKHGNAFRFRAKVYDARGQSVGRWAFDVFLLGR